MYLEREPDKMAEHERQSESVAQEPREHVGAGTPPDTAPKTSWAERPDGDVGAGKSELVAPVQPSERISSIDMIRGFALLGILVLNILSFGLPEAALFNPLPAGGFAGLNFVEWLLSRLFFEHKMMTIFSMLFGAGLLLFTDRAVARGSSPARLFYRRAGILLVFGLLHAYLLWEGDILYTYALCGMALYLARKWRPAILLPLGLVSLLPPALLMPISAMFFAQSREAFARVTAAQAAGQTPSEADKGLAEAWNGVRPAFHPTPEDLAREIMRKSQGSYTEILRERAPGVFFLQAALFPLYMGWDALGRMLIGMALMKLGVFSAERSRRFYLNLMIAGYGIGLPIVALGAYDSVQHQFDVVYLFRGGMLYNDLGSIPVALAHVAALILLYQSGATAWLTRRLAAVGRMALSNYLMHTILCTTLFYGYGFGLFGKLDRVGLFGVVLAIWALQLWLSPIWLAKFRFGPAEWLWRTLTYGKLQPMRV
jgi:uncharacterized protein